MTDFSETIRFDKTEFDVFSYIREAFDFEADKRDKQNDALIVWTGNVRMQITLTPGDARALIVMLNRYIEASEANAAAILAKKTEQEML